MKIFRTLQEIDQTKYFIATYDLEGTKSLMNCAWEIAIGQSVGNPYCRSKFETDDLFENHSCKIIGNEEDLKLVKKGIVDICFPIINTNWKEDGVTQLLVQVMGGNTDISQITRCRLLKLQFPEEVLACFKGPKFGLQSIRSFTKIEGRPLLGGIVKPKTGITPQILLEMVKEMVYGGVSFIKEDEILSNPCFCTIEERVPIIMNFLKEYKEETGRNVIYAVCINTDFPYLLERVKQVHALGGNAIHVNFWNGLGAYKAMRELDLPLFVHYQTSGYKILTDKTHRFSIDFRVICQIAGMSGVDFFHAGMLFGYSGDTEEDIKDYCNILRSFGVCPTMSCGLNKDNVNDITKTIGIDYLANSGGAIHSHEGGTIAGAKAIDEAIISFML
jgi:ribulose 1,5-bisphosphate carboxylase large subunit-like protein